MSQQEQPTAIGNILNVINSQLQRIQTVFTWDGKLPLREAQPEAVLHAVDEIKKGLVRLEGWAKLKLAKPGYSPTATNQEAAMNVTCGLISNARLVADYLQYGSNVMTVNGRISTVVKEINTAAAALANELNVEIAKPEPDERVPVAPPVSHWYAVVMFQTGSPALDSRLEFPRTLVHGPCNTRSTVIDTLVASLVGNLDKPTKISTVFLIEAGKTPERVTWQAVVEEWQKGAK